MKAALFLILLLAMFASAHERQVFEVEGAEYTFVVGSQSEPLHVGDKSGVDLRVSVNDTPIVGLENTLKVEVTAGDQKKVFDLHPAYKQPGAYETTLYLSAPVELSYRFFGDVEGSPFDVTFTCAHAAHGHGSEEDESIVEVSPGVKRILKRGGFTCPRARDEVTMGGSSEMLTGAHAMDHSGHIMHEEHETKTLAALAVSILALLLALAAVLRR